jgi:hypothetical protein
MTMDAPEFPHADPDDERPRELRGTQIDIAVVGWSSFLVAAVGSMVFFAFVDPLTLAEVTEPPLAVDRMTGYAIGFFFFWILSAGSAALTCYLNRSRKRNPPPGD